MCVDPSMTFKGEWIVPLKCRIEGTADMGFLFRGGPLSGRLGCPLQSLPVLIAWGRCVRFVEFPNLNRRDHCLREAGAGGSNPLTPTNNLQ